MVSILQQVKQLKIQLHQLQQSLMQDQLIIMQFSEWIFGNENNILVLAQVIHIIINLKTVLAGVLLIIVVILFKEFLEPGKWNSKLNAPMEIFLELLQL